MLLLVLPYDHDDRSRLCCALMQVYDYDRVMPVDDLLGTTEVYFSEEEIVDTEVVEKGENGSADIKGQKVGRSLSCPLSVLCCGDKCVTITCTSKAALFSSYAASWATPYVHGAIPHACSLACMFTTGNHTVCATSGCAALLLARWCTRLWTGSSSP